MTDSLFGQYAAQDKHQYTVGNPYIVHIGPNSDHALEDDEIFYMAPFELAGETIRFAMPYLAPHSQLLCAIATRMVLQGQDDESIEELQSETGLPPFDIFLEQHEWSSARYMWDPEMQARVYQLVQVYLELYPNETVSRYLDFSMANPPIVDDDNFGTFGALNTPAKATPNKDKRVNIKSRRKQQREAKRRARR